MSFLAPDFEPLLSAEHLRELEATEHTVVGLRADNSMGYRNQAWSRFAAANGAPELVHWGEASVLEAMHVSVRPFYEALFIDVRTTGEPQDHRYQCSSPQAYREFMLRVLPLAGKALLLIHHQATHEPHRWAPQAAGPRYVDEHDIVTQCCHCRRTRRADQRATWDWVPAYVAAHTQRVSHGLCPQCFRHYYPEAAAERDRELS